MQSFMVSLVGLVLSVSVGAEPLLKGRVWLASGPPAAGVHVRLFDLTDLRRSVGTTTDEAGYFALRLQAFSTAGRLALPQDFALGQNYPNPFNPSTIIPYQIPTATHVRLEVFNLLGQRLATLVDGERPAGAHTAQWDATDAAGRAVGAGVFIYRLTGGGHTVSRRMVLIDGQAGIPAGAAGPGSRQTAAVGVKTEGAVYGLTVAGAGLIAYVDPAFRVGTDPVDLVLEQPGGQARMKVATGGILGDVNNDSQVDAFDVLYVALYSKDSSITLPNHGDISLGDVNGDGTVDLADGLLLALYKVNPSDPTLPPGIGQPVDGSGDDHGDTPSSATALAVGSSRSGQLETGGDVDYFRVQVSASGDLTVHTTGNLDTKGQLEDSAGGVLARDDDGGDGFNFRLAHAVSAGTYYIKVEGYDATTTGSYTIHASGPGGGDGPDLIVASASVSDNTLTPAQSFTLNATVRNQGTAAAAATTVHYYQSPDATITADDAPVGTDPVSGLSADQTSAVSIDLTAPSSAGMYYYGACVQSVDGESNTDNNCSAGVSVTVGSGSGDDHGDTPSSSSALAVGSSRSGQLETGGDVDYFRVEVTASGDLTVHTTGSLDTRGQLEDSAGGVLARDDDGGDGYNFRIAHTVSAGTYYIKVEGYDATTTGSYTIHASGPGGGDGGPVNIPDANLRAVIAEALGKAPNAPITPDEMATLTELDAAEQGIRNLAGLEFATNLTWLGLVRNSIAEVSPLAGLTNLTFLSLFDNSIAEVSPLAGLTRLEVLSLSTNNIAEVSPLAGLTNLTQLWLGTNNIAEVSPLAGLTNLTLLFLADNDISDISPLVANTGLGSGDEVFLSDNPLSSTSLNTHIPALESRGVTVHYDDDGGGGDDHGDTPSSATALAVGSSRSGQLETGGDVDYFRVEVTASGELTVHTTGSLDTKGQLEDSAGGVLARDDDGGDGYNFRIAHVVRAGTYYIKVEGYDASATGSYTIHASGSGGDDGDDGGLVSPNGIALDVAAGKMYWTDSGTNKIQRANLGGFQVETLVSTGLEVPFGIALDVAAGKMYWTDGGAASIQRANLDGSQVETLVSTGLGSPVRIALDVAAGKMYWTDGGAASIQRANLDGSQVQTLVDGLGLPDGIALDVAAGKMYWTNFGTASIQRANLDGSQVETLVSTGLERPIGIALDVAAGKMYWTDDGTASIQRANLDGSQVETLVSTGLDSPTGIALDVAAGKMYWTSWSAARIQRANLDGSQVETLVAKDPSGGGGDGDAVSLSISGSLYPASDLLNRKRPVE